MRAELPGEFERLNQAVEHRVAPIETRLAEFHGAFGYARPIRTVIAHRVRQVDEFKIIFDLFEELPHNETS